VGGEIEQNNCTRDILRRHCDHDAPWDKEAKTNLNEGLGKVSPDICVLSYEQLSSSDPWWYILQALSPLVYYYYRILSSARVVK